MRMTLLIIAVTFFCYGNLLAQKTDDEDLVGLFQGEEYLNQALGFSFKVPTKWYVPTKEQINKYLEKANKEFKTGDSKLDTKVGQYEKIEFAISKKK